jgi:hypothetical protein
MIGMTGASPAVALFVAVVPPHPAVRPSASAPAASANQTERTKEQWFK